MNLTLKCYLLLSTILFFSCNTSDDTQSLPQPTNGKTMVNEKGEADGNEKEKWFAMLHSAAPDVDWKNIEAKNRKVKSAKHANSRSNVDCDVIGDYANNQLSGQWLERGSANQSGSMGPMLFDADNELIYSISAGGTIWKSNLEGSSWQPIRDDLVFDWTTFLRFENNGGHRMIALMNKVPYYSDDDGENWWASTGMNTYDNWGNRKRGVVLDDVNKTIYLLIQEWNPTSWSSEIKLYHSIDQGVSYQAIYSFGNAELDNIDLAKVQNSNEIFVTRKTNSFINTYKIDGSGDLVEVNSFSIPNFGTMGNLTAVNNFTLDVLYLSSKDAVYRSYNEGNTWNLRGNLPSEPWSVGVVVSPFHVNHLYYGDIECYQSIDGGENWDLVNGWAAYYNDPANLLHADMMKFSFFKKNDGTEFMAIANHGGINLSYDNLNTTPSIAQNNLNVSQYYSVRTDDDGYVYAGSQDQGFQRSAGNGGVLNFEQVISGDYGHIEFTNGYDHLWTVYPGGWLTYYQNPQTGGLTDSYDLESDNEAAWIPPVMTSPYGDNSVYMAGGNLNGGSGSYIIKFTYGGNGIQTEQLPFNFYSNSGGTIAAMAVSPFNSNNWFVATSNGRFYYSTDGGNDFIESNFSNGPDQHYLYGSTILASKTEENTVYLGGSGYSNAAVYKSTNGGVSFTAMDNGLPSTLVFEIVSNTDESILFAATEAGPYAYVIADELWYDLSDCCAPVQTYWSVEFIENQNTVRYGTYGRGIWDFKIDETSLPIDLISFTAKSKDNMQVDLTWSAANTSNIKKFDIERSQDGINFELLNSTVAENAVDEIEYKSNDFTPYEGTSYYRLKIIERNGTIKYANIVAVTIYKETTIGIYPNPVAYNQPLQFKCAGLEDFQLQLFDEMGKLVINQLVSCGNELPTSALAKGAYFYKIKHGAIVEKGKVLVL